MKSLMPPINTPDNLFHDGNPTTGVEGTIVPAEHLNNEQGSIRDVQSEMIAILTAAAMAPDSTAGQLLAALNKLYAPGNDTLGALASLVGAANKLPYFTGPKGASLTDLTAFAREVLAQTDAAGVLSKLGIKSAGLKDAGTAPGQIPDMSAWASGGNATQGWRRSPDGYIEQWGVSAQTTTNVQVTFPIPFPSGVYRVLERDVGSAGSTSTVIWQLTSVTNTTFVGNLLGTISAGNPNVTAPSLSSIGWFAFGR